MPTENTDTMYQKILHDPLVFGDDIGVEARSILTGLLTRDPTQRLGVNGAEEIKSHPFFANHIDFQKLIQKKIQPPFKPSVSSPVVRPVETITRVCSRLMLGWCFAGRLELRHGVHDRGAAGQCGGRIAAVADCPGSVRG